MCTACTVHDMDGRAPLWRCWMSCLQDGPVVSRATRFAESYALSALGQVRACVSCAHALHYACVLGALGAAPHVLGLACCMLCRLCNRFAGSVGSPWKEVRVGVKGGGHNYYSLYVIRCFS